MRLSDPQSCATGVVSFEVGQPRGPKLPRAFQLLNCHCTPSLQAWTFKNQLKDGALTTYLPLNACRDTSWN